jgi:ribonuclease HI
VGGRLQEFWQQWDLLFQDPWLTDTIRRGFRFNLKQYPPLTVEPEQVQYSEHHVDILQEAVDKLIIKGAVREIPPDQMTPGFYSRIFLVPKKSSSEMRMIHNLKIFNENYLEDPPHFQLLSLRDLRESVRPNDWMASIDLRDAYLHVPIRRKHQRYLRFLFRGRHYQWLVLPFGIAVAPWLFTRLTTPIAGWLHQRGIRFHSYMDDCLVLHQDRTELLLQLRTTQQLLQRLGWVLNMEKSELTPKRTLQFIGATFMTERALVRVPDDRWQSIQTQIAAIMIAPESLKTWQRMLGLLTSAQEVTPRGRLMLRPIQMWLNQHIRRQQKDILEFPRELEIYLNWWTHPCNVLPGISLQPFRTTHHLYADASRTGWGAHMEMRTLSGRWSEGEEGLHINCLELLAVIKAIEGWQETLQGTTMMIATDNTTVAAHINKQGGTHSLVLLNLTIEFYQLVDRLQMRVRARHIPGITNVIADALSRPDRPSPTEWQLHPECFRWICTQLWTPNVDLFATRFNNQLPVYISPIPDPAALDVDALSLSWEGFDAYAFPPTCLLQRLLMKIREENCRMILIAPYWPSRHWFPVLTSLAQQNPLRLPSWRNLLRAPHTRQLHPNPDLFDLHAWTLLPPV